jgi:hypothetical protein
MAAPNLVQAVSKLGRLKKQLAALEEQMALIKEKIKPYLVPGPVTAGGARANYVKGYESFDLKKEKMRYVLQAVLKLSPVMVDKIMLMGADKRIVNDYVKVTLEKS